MRILELAFKDLSQILRDKRSFLFLVVMPMMLTFFMGFAYRGMTEEADNRIRLALVDPEPESRLNKMLSTRLDTSDLIKVIVMTEAEAMDALRKGDVAGVLVVPVGFSDQAKAGSEPSQQYKQLKLIADTTSVDGQSLYQLLRVPVSQLMSAAEVARISADVQSNPGEYVPSIELAWSKWNEASQAPLVRVEQAVAEKSSDWTGGNPYNQSSPGMLVQFAIFGLVTSGQILMQERKSRTLQRLITTTMKPREIVAGHMLAMFAITFMQIVLLLTFGQWILKVDYLREPLGVLLVSVALGLWIAAMGLLIGVVAKDEQAVILFSMIAMFAFSALGGTWFPLETTGGAFAAIGKAMPSAWAMNGLQNILIRGLGLESVWMPVTILLAYAFGFFVIAVWRFRKTEI